MKAAFHYMGCVCTTPEGIWVRSQFGPLIEELAHKLDHLWLVNEVTKTNTNQNFEGKTDYLVKADNIDIISLGDYHSKKSKLLTLLKLLFGGTKATKQLDFLLVRAPTRRIPLFNLLWGKLPKVLLLGGDWETNLKTQRGIVLWRARFFHKQMKKAMSQALVFVNNQTLLDKWRSVTTDIYLTRTTTLTQKDIITSLPEKTLDQKINWLFVGRIDPLKGLHNLIDAFHSLNSKGLGHRLTIIGTGDAPFVKEIEQYIQDKNLEQNIELLGYLPVHELWQHYQSAHVFVLPTLAENVARTVWEAMSQGCPVVTTPVGGHATTFHDQEDVLFCEAGNTEDLEIKINQLLNSPMLYQKLRENGWKRAQANTTEKRVEELLAKTTQWLNQAKK